MEWNDETILRLRTLWDEAHSTAEIGRRLGVSKNAVVGKAHRLGLSPRPSPIRREAAASPRPAPARRLIGPTLPPLPAEAVSVSAPAAVPEPPPTLAAPVAVSPRPAPSPPKPPAAPVLAALATRTGRLQACCWPLGDPGTRSFRFCDANSVAGKPYCAEHAQLAYVRVRDRRDEAA